MTDADDDSISELRDSLNDTQSSLDDLNDQLENTEDSLSSDLGRTSSLLVALFALIAVIAVVGIALMFLMRREFAKGRNQPKDEAPTPRRRSRRAAIHFERIAFLWNVKVRLMSKPTLS